MTKLDVINRKGEVVAALEIEGATATPSEIEIHYTHFVKLFMRHLGRNLKVIVRKPMARESARY